MFVEMSVLENMPGILFLLTVSKVMTVPEKLVQKQ